MMQDARTAVWRKIRKNGQRKVGVKVVSVREVTTGQYQARRRTNPPAVTMSGSCRAEKRHELREGAPVPRRPVKAAEHCRSLRVLAACLVVLILESLLMQPAVLGPCRLASASSFTLSLVGPSPPLLRDCCRYFLHLPAGRTSMRAVSVADMGLTETQCLPLMDLLLLFSFNSCSETVDVLQWHVRGREAATPLMAGQLAADHLLCRPSRGSCSPSWPSASCFDY